MEKELIFSKWRSRLWPIHRSELKKFLPLFLLKFLVSINFVILATTKDTLIITGKHSGAEVVAILKGWVVLPSALLVLLIYTKLSNKLSLQKLVYTSLAPFLIFFFLFGYVLYPNQEFFTPHELCAKLFALLGEGHSHWVAPIYSWMNSIFFVVAELWGQVVIMLLFWTYANYITPLNQAKRFYTLFTAAGDFGPMLGGLFVAKIATKNIGGDYVNTVQQVCFLAILVGLAIAGIYWWMNRYVLTDEKCLSSESRQKLKKEKPSLSIKESFKFILSSKYLMCLAIMVISYGLAISLAEIAWKASSKMLYPDSNQYQQFMGKISFFCGFFPLIMAVFAGGNILRKFGWTITAMVTPLVVGGTGVLFLLLATAKDHLGWTPVLLGISPLGLIVTVGALQSIASKTMKYSLFDPTKEMAFIPLDSESKVKGKAAIDVVGSRLGKSGSSWLQTGLLDTFAGGNILNATMLLTPMVAIVVCGWIWAVKNLGKEFKKASGKESMSAQ
ncbi:MAG: Npt1/Npt2 family nucleotide transporter (plasmid) [Candidatus Algichlamydia australiensis]|nr:Npt1/Npt2 family nucleotide transporter [Chlamydiales bacterium]